MRWHLILCVGIAACGCDRQSKIVSPAPDPIQQNVVERATHPMEPGASADEALARLVGDAIQREPGVVRNLVVRVGDGVVTLRGTTLSEADKARIIMQTRTVPGVVRVVDEIVVEQ